MKKKLLALVCFAALIVLSFSSCSKSKTCECVVTVSIMGITQSETVTGDIDDGDCEDIPEIAQAKEALGDYGTIDVSCKEK
jgi:hypothetical protein